MHTYPPLLTDAKITEMWQRINNSFVDAREPFSFQSGAEWARSIYEPHRLRLLAEIDELKAEIRYITEG